jgi:hypothetical protein
MKKLYFIAIALLISVSMFAQSNFFGPRIGVNFANLSSDADDADAYKMKIGYVGGFTAGGSFGKSKFGGQFSILYSTKGAKMDISEGDVKGTGSVTYNYLTLPFNFYYEFGNKDFKIYPCFGFYTGYTLSGKVEGDVAGITVSEKLKVGMEKTDDLNSMDIGYTLGLCAEVKKFQISVQYEKGVFSTVPAGKNIRELTNVVCVSLAYMFSRKIK